MLTHDGVPPVPAGYLARREVTANQTFPFRSGQSGTAFLANGSGVGGSSSFPPTTCPKQLRLPNQILPAASSNTLPTISGNPPASSPSNVNRVGWIRFSPPPALAAQMFPS